MESFKRPSLRWRLLAAQMLVVIVGVFTLGVALEAVLQRADLTEVESQPASNAKETIEVASGELRTIVRRFALNALLVAATSATIAGFATSWLLTRDILHPLREIGRSSKRIAQGQYNERVTLPESREFAELAANFNQMAIALENIERQRVALIGNVAHELRTPLTGLEGYLEGLLDGIFPTEPETFSQMQQEVRRLSRLVNDLQALSRIEAGQIPLNLQPFDLLPLIERVLTQLRPQASGLTLTFEGNHYPCVVLADTDRTAQVLLNLIGNAIRYTPEGGQVIVRVHRHTEKAEIEIEDTGIGIPAEALPYLFERFYRVDRSRSRKSGGSGIGLTITRHLVWAMGGELRVTSEGEGKGSTFCFTLPLAPTPKQ